MIDYRSIPGVQEWIDRTHELLADDDERKRRAGNMLRFEDGETLILELTVTDVDLFQIVASAVWSDEVSLSVPGAKIEVIRFRNPGVEFVVEWLEEQLRTLREGSE